MKILMASTPATGHINPLLAIGHVLMAEGHELVGLSGSWLQDRIEHAGAQFRALPGRADVDLRNLATFAPELAKLPPGHEWLRVAIERVFIDPLLAQHMGLQQALQDFRADVILADDMFFGVLPMLLGPPPSARRSHFAVHRSCIGAAKTARRTFSACGLQRQRRSWSDTPRLLRNMSGVPMGLWSKS